MGKWCIEIINKRKASFQLIGYNTFISASKRSFCKELTFVLTFFSPQIGFRLHLNEASIADSGS